MWQGANTVETLYRVVFHGMSKFDIDFKTEEIIAQIQGPNSEKLTIVETETLMKRPQNLNAPTQSIVISLKCPK